MFRRLFRRRAEPADGASVSPNGARQPRHVEEEEEDFKEMELWEHLAELRQRMIRSILYVSVAAVAGWILYPPVEALFRAPLDELARRYYIFWAYPHITTPFFLRLKVALLIGLAIACPLVLGEVWGFVAPGLTRRERRVFYSILPMVVVCFVVGCVVGYLVLWPALDYFAGFLPPRPKQPTAPSGVAPGTPIFDAAGRLIGHLFPPGSAPTTGTTLPSGADGSTPILIQNPADYLMFIVKMILAFGAVFQLPVVLMGLAYAGVLDSRFLLRQWKTAIILMAMLAAVITPSGDAMTMSLMLAPLVVLYFGSIVIVRIVERKRDPNAGQRRRGWRRPTRNPQRDGTARRE